MGVIFTHKIKYDTSPVLTICGSLLKFENKAKFLGMILDKRLTWNEHVKYIEDRCKARLNLMRSLSGTNWGASKESLLTVYEALVRPLLQYGAEAMDSASQAAKTRLDTIQSKALRIACGAMHGTAVAALQNECGEPPLKLGRLQQQLKYLLKVNLEANHPSKCVFEDHWTNHYGKSKLNNTSLFNKLVEYNNEETIAAIKENSGPPWLSKPINTDTSLTKVIMKANPSHCSKAIALDTISRYNDCLAIYTDGSKSEEGRTAASFVIPMAKESKNVRLSDKISVYTAELTAIKLSLEWVMEHEAEEWSRNGNRSIAIFSDSLSSVESIARMSSNSRPNLIKEVFDLGNKIKNNITVIWVPSHVGIAGNEEADKLAKAALQNIDVDIKIKRERTELFGDISNVILEKWQDLFNASSTGTQNRLVAPIVTFKSKYSDKSNRSKEVLISRLRLGKCRLNWYLFKMKRHNTGMCDVCNVKETIEHHLLYCKGNDTPQALDIESKRLGLTLSLQTALNEPNLRDIIFRHNTRHL